MANTRNGTWKLLIWLSAALIGLGGAYATIGWNKDRIDKMEPEVQKNTQYRVKDEEATIWLKKEMANIERGQKEILDEVRKLR